MTIDGACKSVTGGMGDGECLGTFRVRTITPLTAETWATLIEQAPFPDFMVIHVRPPACAHENFLYELDGRICRSVCFKKDCLDAGQRNWWRYRAYPEVQRFVKESLRAGCGVVTIGEQPARGILYLKVGGTYICRGGPLPRPRGFRLEMWLNRLSGMTDILNMLVSRLTADVQTFASRIAKGGFASPPPRILTPEELDGAFSLPDYYASRELVLRFFGFRGRALRDAMSEPMGAS